MESVTIMTQCKGIIPVPGSWHRLFFMMLRASQQMLTAVHKPVADSHLSSPMLAKMGSILVTTAHYDLLKLFRFRNDLKRWSSELECREQSIRGAKERVRIRRRKTSTQTGAVKRINAGYEGAGTMYREECKTSERATTSPLLRFGVGLAKAALTKAVEEENTLKAGFLIAHARLRLAPIETTILI